MGAGRHLFRVGVLGALMAAMVALSAAVATAEEVPDASCQVTGNTTGQIGDNYPGPATGVNISVAQTFTALNSGRLSTAEVPLGDSEHTGTLVMEIREVDTSGTPSATDVLASTSILASDIPNENTPVRGHFGPAAEVMAGQQYALVLRSSDGSFYARYSNTSNPSCSGTAYFSFNGGAFSASADHDLIFSTFVDLTPLATKDSYSTVQDTPLRVAAPGLLSNDWVRTGRTLTAVEVTDGAHGEVFARTDGSFAYFPDEAFVGEDSFTYKASDGSDTSNAATVEITVKDATAPVTTLNSSGPSGTVNSASASFTFSSNEVGATFECKLDGGAFTPCTSPKGYTVANGSHTFSVRARDAAGNVDASPASRTWKVDTLKPTVSGMSPRHTSITRDTTPTIKAVVRDNLTNLQKANIKLYLNGALISPTKYSYSASTDVLVYNSPRLTLGKKTVKIVATDAARNVGTRSWYFTIK